jgi:hypothetical protein
MRKYYKKIDNIYIININNIMTNTMICTFCKNKGILPPHNHTVRNWTLPDRPIICPQLLSTQCSFCNKNGHTKQYCPMRHSFIKYSNQTNHENIENNLKRQLEQINITSNKIQKN